jgi:adenylylsulfate kinase
LVFLYSKIKDTANRQLNLPAPRLFIQPAWEGTCHFLAAGPFCLMQARNAWPGGTVPGKIRKESETLTIFCLNKIQQQIHQRQSGEKKQALLQQRPVAVWMTGLPAAGKSTLASRLEDCLLEKGYFTHWLDGDDLRSGLTSDLGFSADHQEENIRRSAEVAKLLTGSGIITICTFLSPTHHLRSIARNIIGSPYFLEVYVNCPLAVCIQRDEKNMYGGALRGQVINLTGVNFPYEPPLHPWLELHTHYYSVEASVNQLLEAMLPLIEPA